MASFEDLLMQTMPLAGALNLYNVRRAETVEASRVAEEKDDPPTPDPGEFPGLFSGQTIGYDDMMVDRLEVDESFEVAKPEIEASDYETPHEVPIWRWKHEADTPWRIRNVSCRSRSASYRTYAVATAIEWGFESETEKGPLKNCVRIVNLAGKVIELPVTKDFVTYKARIRGGQIANNQTDLWKLPSNHDQSLVMAFVYSLEPGQPPRRMTADQANDFGDDFMPQGGAAAQTGAEVHGETSADLEHPRVIVILSLTTCKQSEDFAPGGIVGMGRIYPHVMVMSNMPLSRIEATVRVNRPEKSILTKDKVEPPADIGSKFMDIFTGPKGCCSTYDHDADTDEDTINSVFFADANDFSISTLKDPPLPFWSNFFAYYLLDAHQTISNQTVVAVTRDKDMWRLRDPAGMIIRQPVTGPSDYAKLIKLPCQGEFDNLHMAPKMKLHKVKRAIHSEKVLEADNPSVGLGGAPMVSFKDFDVPLASLHLDDISMAPFCSHDCFHTHWRWGKDATDTSQLGFAGAVPYKKAGAPLIPDNQSIKLWLRAPNLLTYAATVWPQGEKPISANEWQVIMHHGSAYALDITAYMMAYLAKFSVDTFCGQPVFYADAEALTTPITSAMSFSVFYWKLRWETILENGAPRLRERVFNKDLPAARKT
jgi:hypothetical protein